MRTATAAMLRARYPLPPWDVDSAFKRELTATVAAAVGRAAERAPGTGPTAMADYAAAAAEEAREALRPLLSWLEDSPTDGVSYPGDPLVSYISQLALTHPGEEPDAEAYRALLRAYAVHLAEAAAYAPGA